MASDRRMRAIRLYTIVKTDPVTAKRLGAFEKTRGFPPARCGIPVGGRCVRARRSVRCASSTGIGRSDM